MSTTRVQAGTVLLSTRVTEEQSYHEPRSAIAHDYIAWFESLGYLVVPVPAVTERAAAYLRLTDIRLVVLTGGNNVDPLLYGGAGGVSQVYPERDRTEYELIRAGLAAGLPVWGICRGLQTINVYFGGSLTQSVSGHVAQDHGLQSEYELLRGVRCNSYHNQAVRSDDLAAPLQALAQSEEGLVEALYHPELPVAAVQWHPERQNREYDRRLLDEFLSGRLRAC